MTKKILFLLLFYSTVFISKAQVKYSIENDSLTKYLVLYSNSIEAFPIWENNTTILINIYPEGWKRVRLEDIRPETSSGLEKTFGFDYAYKGEKVNDISFELLDSNKAWRPRLINIDNKRRIEIRQIEFNSQFIIIEDNIEFVVMNIKGNAHSVAISPNGKYAAFIAEMSGIMVVEIENELQNAKKKEAQFSKLNSLEKAIYFFTEKDFTNFRKYLYIAKSENANNKRLNYYLGKFNFQTRSKLDYIRDSVIYYLNQTDDSKEFDDKYLMLAKIYEEKRDPEKTIKYADIAIEKMPNNPLPFFVKGLAYAELRDVKGVCEYMGKACDLGDEYACNYLDGCEKK